MTNTAEKQVDHIGDSELNRAILEEAWHRVHSRRGAPGVDGISVEAYDSDLSAQLNALLTDLQNGNYTPQSYRAVDIPKSSGGYRRIVIATVRDRVLQSALTIVLQPTVESLLHPCSFAYRRGIGVQDALLKVVEYRKRGFQAVLRGDIENFFDSVRHDLLMEQLQAADIDEPYMNLIKKWLKAEVEDRFGCKTIELGLPQGLPISPLLANLYLTPFDRALVDGGWKLVRYADDMAVCCTDGDSVQSAREEADRALAPLGLRLSKEKTKSETFAKGFMFLGAKFIQDQLIPAMPHPYEADFTPPPRPKGPRRPPAQTVPHMLMRTLYIQQQGSRLGCHGDRLVVSRSNSTLLDIPVHYVDQVFTFGRVHITAPAMSFCLYKGIPIHLFTARARYNGVLQRMRDCGLIWLRGQFEACEQQDRRLLFSQAVVAAKVSSCRNLLKQHVRNHPEVDLEQEIQELGRWVNRIPEADNLDQLRGFEGNAAGIYYRGLSKCFRSPFTFSRRVRRPPTDPINSLLSFGYTLTLYNVHSYICARGLSPFAGLFHEPRADHPALASDLLEELRAPIVDSLILSLANRAELSPDDFYFAEGKPQPCFLRDEPRCKFIAAFEERMMSLRRHPDVQFEVDWRRIIDLQVLRFRRYVAGAVERYIPYRWK